MSLVFWLIFANIDQTAKADGSLIISITSICLKSGHTPCLGNVNICLKSVIEQEAGYTPGIAKGEQDVRRPF